MFSKHVKLRTVGTSQCVLSGHRPGNSSLSSSLFRWRVTPYVKSAVDSVATTVTRFLNAPGSL